MMKLSSDGPTLYRVEQSMLQVPHPGVAPSTISASKRQDFSSVHHSSLSTQPIIWHRMTLTKNL